MTHPTTIERIIRSYVFFLLATSKTLNMLANSKANIFLKSDSSLFAALEISPHSQSKNKSIKIPVNNGSLSWPINSFGRCNFFTKYSRVLLNSDLTFFSFHYLFFLSWYIPMFSIHHPLHTHTHNI